MENSIAPQRVSAKGGEAPLNLIIGHLTESQYIPVTRPLLPDQEQPKNWYRPSVDYDPSKPLQVVAKLQPFVAGGYECTVSVLDLQKVARAMDEPRKPGKREKTEQKEEDIASSVQRSKRRIRYLIKSMACDRMLTLTGRENNPEEYRTVEEWQVLWDKFNRMCKKAGFPLQYVAVLERHKKGNYHLHAAISGRCNINLLRRFWYICLGGKGNEKGGNTPGNVQVSYKQGMSDHRRRAGLAKYCGKYLSKQIEQTEFNKKRYWSSRHKLPPVRRYILSADDMQSAMIELAEFLGLNYEPLKARAFQTETVIWFSYDDDLSKPPPF